MPQRSCSRGRTKSESSEQPIDHWLPFDFTAIPPVTPPVGLVACNLHPPSALAAAYRPLGVWLWGGCGGGWHRSRPGFHASPVVGLGAAGFSGPGCGDPAPVVMNVFDEFPVASLLDQHGRIDEEHFPNFSRLAEDGTWFRNALAITSSPRRRFHHPQWRGGAGGGRSPEQQTFRTTCSPCSATVTKCAAVEPLTELCPAFVCTADPGWRASSLWNLDPHLAVVTHRPFLTDDAPQSAIEQSPSSAT